MSERRRSLQYTVLTDPAGQSSNEDACAALDLPGCAVLIVADGVGGHACGDVASALVVETVRDYIAAHADERADAPTLLRSAFATAQDAMRSRIDANPRLRTMRTTLIVALATREVLWIAHVGDSRAYLARGADRIEQVTHDDTLVQSLLDLGQIDREAARTHSKSNVLLQSVGDPKDLEVHVSEAIAVRAGDVLIVCSDGLSDVLDDAALLQHTRLDDAGDAANALLEAALAANAPDNVTVGVVRWREEVRTAATSKRARRKQRSDRVFFSVVLACIAVTIALAAIALRRGRFVHRSRAHTAATGR